METVENNVKSSFLQVGKVENVVDKRGKCVNNKNTLWKNPPQQFYVEDMICMKKLLAICSIFFSICATFTGCGSEDTPYDSNNDSVVSSDEKNGRDDDRKSDSVGDHVNDAIGGVGEAGEDIIGGATDAADDIIDGLDGDEDHDKKDNNSRTTTATRKR